MTVEHRSNTHPRVERPHTLGWVLRSLGHVLAIAVNLIMLFVVRNIGEWDLLPFLTDDYQRVIGALSFGIIVTIVGRVVQILLPGRRVKILVDGIVTAVGFFVLIRVLRVFPFDFDPDGIRWDVIIRLFLILGLVGSAIAVLVTPLRLLQRDVGS